MPIESATSRRPAVQGSTVDPTSMVPSTVPSTAAAPATATSQGPGLVPDTTQTPLPPAVAATLGARRSAILDTRLAGAATERVPPAIADLVRIKNALPNAADNHGHNHVDDAGRAIYEAREGRAAQTPEVRRAIDEAIADLILAAGRLEVETAELHLHARIDDPARTGSYSLADSARLPWAWVDGGGKAEVEPLADYWVELAQQDSPAAAQARQLLLRMAAVGARESEVGWERGGQVKTAMPVERRIALLSFDRFALDRARIDDLIRQAEAVLAEGDGAFAQRILSRVRRALPETFSVSLADLHAKTPEDKAKLTERAIAAFDAEHGARGLTYEAVKALEKELGTIAKTASPAALNQEARFIYAQADRSPRWAITELGYLKDRIDRANDDMLAAPRALVEGLLAMAQHLDEQRTLAAMNALSDKARGVACLLDLGPDAVQPGIEAAYHLGHLAEKDARLAPIVQAFEAQLEPAWAGFAAELDARITAMRSEPLTEASYRKADVELWGYIEVAKRIGELLGKDTDAIEKRGFDQVELMLAVAEKLVTSGALSRDAKLFQGLEGEARYGTPSSLDPVRAKAIEDRFAAWKEAAEAADPDKA